MSAQGCRAENPMDLDFELIDEFLRQIATRDDAWAFVGAMQEYFEERV
jgi:hypothetical protein